VPKPYEFRAGWPQENYNFFENYLYVGYTFLNYLGRDRNRPEVSDDFTVRMASMVIHFIPLCVIAPEGRTL
jgi:hypothetical protein